MAHTTDPKHPLSPLGDGPVPEAGARDQWLVLPKHGPCFVCDTTNPGGLQADLYRDADAIRCPFTFRIAQQGPPGHAHGGAIAALLDEIMGACAWLRRPEVLAVHLAYDLRKPTPLYQEVMAIGWVHSDGNRSVRVAAEIRLPSGAVAVQATGVFAMAPGMFDQPFFG